MLDRDLRAIWLPSGSIKPYRTSIGRLSGRHGLSLRKLLQPTRSPRLIGLSDLNRPEALSLYVLVCPRPSCLFTGSRGPITRENKGSHHEFYG
jgi:hypothetical protein